MASVGSGLPSHKSTIVKQLMSNGIIDGGGLLTQTANTTFTETVQFIIDTLTFSETIDTSTEEDATPVVSS